MSEIEKLQDLLEATTAALPSVESKKMFGCQAAWVKGNVFALVWKKGRLALKLPDPQAFDKLMGETGAGPWKIGPKVMGHWVFIPKSWHGRKAAVTKWVKTAHELNAKGPAKAAKKKAAKKKTAKKVAKKKIAKKTTAKKKAAKKASRRS